jgi:hemoglobin/transferrin/lactoferrin receptor protein
METKQKSKRSPGRLANGSLACAVASVAFVASAQAQDYIETVTVIGTKTERAVGEVAGALTIISEEEIDRRMMRDIADLIKYEPGVSVAGTGERWGLSGFSIRGIGGNRVLTLVDGVQVPEQFSFGPFLNARRDFVSIESMANIEIAKGSGSSLYGSDAMGGVVAIKTRRPQDYVDSDNPLSVVYKGGYSSEDQGLVNTLSLAGQLSAVSGLLEYTDTRASETETQGESGYTASARQEADPADIENSNLRVAIGFDAFDLVNVMVDYENFSGETDSDVLSDSGAVVYGTLIDSRTALDTRDRTKSALRLSLNDKLWVFDSVDFTAYTQDGTNEQLTSESRTSYSGPQTRTRYSEYDHNAVGYNALVTFSGQIGASSHVISVGVDYSEDAYETMRTGATFNSAGTSLPEYSAFPTRDFPTTDITETGIFLQDEIAMLDGRLRVTPAIRYDEYDAKVSPDVVWVAGHRNEALPEEFSDSDSTASISAVYRLSDAVRIYARYGQGFRAPPANAVNAGFENLRGGYKVISNADLQSETSTGTELGLRFSGDDIYLEATVFQNSYEDFIEENVIAPAFLAYGGVDPADGLLAFTSVNRGEVSINGFEMSGEMSLSYLTNSRGTSDTGWQDNFKLMFAFAYADGQDEVADEPIDSIEPINGVFGLRYNAPSELWSTELTATFASGKQAEDVAAANRHLSDGYVQLDLIGQRQFGTSVAINFGVFNLLDKEYIRWVDTAAIGSDAVQRFTQPGLHYGANIRITL